MTITLRSTKGSILTHSELDANFTTLDTEKADLTDLAASSGSSLVGFIQSGTGAVATDLQTRGRLVIYAKTDFGVTGSGDETSKIQAAEDEAHSSGKLLSFAGLSSATFTSKLTFRAGSHDIDFAGCKLITSGLTSGYAVEFLPYSTLTNERSGLPEIRGFWLVGPSDESNNLDGVYFGQGSLGGGNTAYTKFVNFTVEGFRDNTYLANNAYILGFWNPFISDAWRRGVNGDLQATAGENINFHGGVVGDCVHSGGTAVAVYTPASSAASINFHGTSFDYCDYLFDITNSKVSLFGCHLENDSVNPMGKVTHSSGTGSELRIVGGVISPTGTPVRTHLFEASGGGATIEIDGPAILSGYNYEIIKVTSGFPRIAFRGFADVTTSSTADTFPNPGDNLNLIYNGDAELNATTGWTTSFVGAGAFAATSAEAQSGTYSFSLTGDGTAGLNNVYQELRVLPGQSLLVSLWYKGTRTAGSFEPQMQFLSANGSTVTPAGVNLRIGGLNMQADVTSWSRAGQRFVVPPGAISCRLRVLTSGFNGTIYTDNIRLHVA